MDTPERKLSLAKIFGGGFLLIGILVTIIGLIWSARTSMFVMQAAKAPGTVIEMERSTSSEGGSTYRPVFFFADASGIVHTQTTSSGSSSYTFETGEKVTILYDPTTPKHSKIDSFQTVWFGPLFVTVFGVLSGGFSVFWLFLATRGIKFEQSKNIGF